MSNTLYPKAKEAILSGLVDLTADDIRVILVDTGDYTYNAAHDFLDDVAAGSRVEVSAALENKTIASGVFDADDVTLESVTGDQSEALILYIHTGTEGTSRLLAYIDTFSVGMPVTPNGGDIGVQWNASGIFSI